MLQTTTRSVSATGNGAATQFAVAFRFFSASDLVVTVAGATQTLGVDYTVSGAGSSTGGVVTFVSAPGDGDAVLIERTIPLTQAVALKTGATLDAPTLETALDRAVAIAQQLDARLDAVEVLAQDFQAQTLPTYTSATRPAASALLLGASILVDDGAHTEIQTCHRESGGGYEWVTTSTGGL